MDAQTSLFFLVLFWIYCGINLILSVTALFLESEEAENAYALNMTIAVINFLAAIFSYGFYLEEKKKRQNDEPFDEILSVFSNESLPSYHSFDLKDPSSLNLPVISVVNYENENDNTN